MLVNLLWVGSPDEKSDALTALSRETGNDLTWLPSGRSGIGQGGQTIGKMRLVPSNISLSDQRMLELPIEVSQ